MPGSLGRVESARGLRTGRAACLQLGFSIFHDHAELHSAVSETLAERGFLPVEDGVEFFGAEAFDWLSAAASRFEVGVVKFAPAIRGRFLFRRGRSRFAIVKLRPETMPPVGAALDLSQRFGPLSLAGLVAGVDRAELEAKAGEKGISIKW